MEEEVVIIIAAIILFAWRLANHLLRVSICTCLYRHTISNSEGAGRGRVENRSENQLELADSGLVQLVPVRLGYCMRESRIIFVCTDTRCAVRPSPASRYIYIPFPRVAQQQEYIYTTYTDRSKLDGKRKKGETIPDGWYPMLYATAQTCICTAAFVPNTPNMKMLAAGRYFGKEMTRKQTETEWLGYTVGRNISYVDV